MATFTLNVPLVAQTKSSTCWHASAEMIWLYWQNITRRQGPMFTIVNKWVNNEPVQPADFIVLAKNVGLREVTRSQQYTSDGLSDMLKDQGPIWCAGYWYGLGHIIVLTGIDGDTVLLNDPDGGVVKAGLLSWFNTKLSNNLPGCLMSKDPTRY